MSNSVIEVENLSKVYQISHQSVRADTFRDTIAGLLKQRGRSKDKEEFQALRDVSFQVQQSEVLGIIGRNGAGKSTLLKILSRITEPTRGRIKIKGRVASLLEVGTGFHPELSGRENIFLNGAILGMSRKEIRSKFDEIVDFAGVEKFIDTPVKRYSSGMYVRLAFSVAAHLEPEILIIDEVLAVGDAEFQRKCIGQMQNSAKQGRTVLFVSHNMKAILSLCKSSMVLDSGKVLFQGEPMQATQHYLSLGASAKSIDVSNTAPDIVTLEACTINSPSAANAKVDFQSDLGFNFKLFCKDSAADLNLGISINSANDGKRVFGTSTSQSGNPLPTFKGELNASLHLTDQKLAPGNYDLEIAITANGICVSRCIITHAIVVVEAVDSWASGTADIGVYAINHEWHF